MMPVPVPASSTGASVGGWWRASMAATMAGGMVPPIAMAIATVLARR